MHDELQTISTAQSEKSGHRERFGNIALFAALLLLMGLMFSGVFLSRFSPDESQWIYTARYLTLFREGDFQSPEWHNYWTQTQPPLARYIMGASLKVVGNDLLKLNGPWDFTKEPDRNAALGNMPAPDVLFWARLPMAIIASLSVLLLYLIGNQAGGGVAGLGAAAWLAINPRSRELMTRAEADGILVCLMLLSLLLTIKLLHECEQSQSTGRRWLRPLLRTAMLGVVTGLAATDKLTGALSLVAVSSALGADIVVRWVIELRHTSDAGRLRLLGRRVLGAAASIVGMTAIAVLLFVLLNPTLYDDPVASSVAQFNFRESEMEQQMVTYPTAALSPGLPRVESALVRTLFTYSVSAGLFQAVTRDSSSDIAGHIPLDALLVAIGIIPAIVFLLSAWKRAARGEDDDTQAQTASSGVGAVGTALVFTGVFFAGIVLNLGLDWDRYTLPLWVFAALWAGMGIEQLRRWLAQRLPATRHRTALVRNS